MTQIKLPKDIKQRFTEDGFRNFCEYYNCSYDGYDRYSGEIKISAENAVDLFWLGANIVNI